MQTIFTYSDLLVNDGFGLGLLPAPVVEAARTRDDEPTALDVAWLAGRDAAASSDCPVYPPSHYSIDECDAFLSGAAEGARGGDWDSDADEVERRYRAWEAAEGYRVLTGC